MERTQNGRISWAVCPRDAGQAVRLEHTLDWEGGVAWRRFLHPEIDAQWEYQQADISDYEGEIDLQSHCPRLGWVDAKEGPAE